MSDVRGFVRAVGIWADLMVQKDNLPLADADLKPGS